jgi:hypothetical protein
MIGRIDPTDVRRDDTFRAARGKWENAVTEDALTVPVAAHSRAAVESRTFRKRRTQAASP